MSKNIDKYRLYSNAFCNAIEQWNEVSNDKESAKDAIKRIIIYGVKMVNTKGNIEVKEYTREDIEHDFQIIEIIKALIGTLTPKDFMNLYPPAKEYKGKKYGIKDYHYTMDYISKMNINSPIGANTLEFLWEYHNWELTDFNVEVMECISRFRKLDGKPSLASEFADMMRIKTYRMYDGVKGQQFVMDNETGKTKKIIKKRPRYLKLVK